MNATKIEWCTRTWSPVTGCLHACGVTPAKPRGWCYARKITESRRFNGRPTVPGLHVLEEPVRENNRVVPWPYGFGPTFHRYRLGEPLRARKPQRVFVCDMSDLFGAWVPDTWIAGVLNACGIARRHTYLFLTKNPERYAQWASWLGGAWLGASASNTATLDRALAAFSNPALDGNPHRFISLEPWLEDLELPPNIRQQVQWLIIGGLTGPGARKPDPMKLDRLVRQAQGLGLSVFVKKNAGEGPQDLPG